jgi:hypothetical protein
MTLRSARPRLSPGSYSRDLRKDRAAIGRLQLDASFSPIRRVTHVGACRAANGLDKLILDIETNGTIGPEEAIRRAGAILKGQLSVFVIPQETGTRAPRRPRAAIRSICCVRWTSSSSRCACNCLGPRTSLHRRLVHGPKSAAARRTSAKSLRDQEARGTASRSAAPGQLAAGQLQARRRKATGSRGSQSRNNAPQLSGRQLSRNARTAGPCSVSRVTAASRDHPRPCRRREGCVGWRAAHPLERTTAIQPPPRIRAAARQRRVDQTFDTLGPRFKTASGRLRNPARESRGDSAPRR